MTPVALLSAGAAGLAAHAAVNALLLRVPTATVATARVSVLLPLRDEAARVEPCLRALLAQTGVDLELVVLDDGSTDGTPELVRSIVDGDPRVRVLDGRPLPAGWLGKPHACQQLADAAAPSSEVLVYVDADVVLAPHAVAATVALLDEQQLDLLSPYPRQQAPGATALVQPLLQWSWLTFLPLRLAERSPRPSLSAANGQLLAVRRTSYDRAGGHAAVARWSRTSRCCAPSSAPARRVACATGRPWRPPGCTTPGPSWSTATTSRCGPCRSRPWPCWHCCTSSRRSPPCAARGPVCSATAPACSAERSAHAARAGRWARPSRTPSPSRRSACWQGDLGFVGVVAG